jgi:hypothetical protein
LSFKGKKVFIIGAGASAEANLPTGAKLIEVLGPRLRFKIEGGSFEGNSDIFSALKYASRKQDMALVGVGDRICNALNYALSIDNVIDVHSTDEDMRLCGKIGIAHAILESERRSALYFNRFKERKFRVQAIKNTWYHRFAQLLHTGVIKGDRESVFENVSIITFNYDRTIEHFLPFALADVYSLTLIEAQEITKRLKIFHPYGQVGSLPWQEKAIPIEYGDEVDTHMLINAASQIQTFTEQVEDEDKLTAMRGAMADADALIFLGFAFHEQNMALIDASGKLRASRVLATTHGVSKCPSGKKLNRMNHM